MVTKTVERAKCDGCGECVEICANSRVIALDEDGFPDFVAEHQCIFCGHCMAVCPQGAITFTEGLAPMEDTYFAAAETIGTDSHEGIPATELLGLLHSIRSERFFRDEEVSRSHLELILQAMVRSPSAGNEQNRSFYVFDTKSKVDELDHDTMTHYAAMANRMRSPFAVSMAARMMARKRLDGLVMRNDLMRSADKGERLTLYRQMLEDLRNRNADGGRPYFGGATAAFVVTSNTNTLEFHKPFHKADVAIAVTYGTVAAAALGLGTCWMGLCEMAMNKDRAMKAKYQIPENERIDGVLAVGYSATQWRQVPPRGPVKAVWR